MTERLRHLLERFPERAESIRALGESHARFRDLLADHHEVGEAISRMSAGDRESQAGRFAELKRRRVNLEEELIRLMEEQQRP